MVVIVCCVLAKCDAIEQGALLYRVAVVDQDRAEGPTSMKKCAIVEMFIFC